MKKRSIILFILVSGCAPPPSELSRPSGKSVSAGPDKNDQGELSIWAYYNIYWQHAFESFQKKYPNVTFKVESFTYDTSEDQYLEALLSGDVPDVMIFDHRQFRNFKAIDGLEDLNDPPYYTDQLKSDFPDPLWGNRKVH